MPRQQRTNFVPFLPLPDRLCQPCAPQSHMYTCRWAVKLPSVPLTAYSGMPGRGGTNYLAPSKTPAVAAAAALGTGQPMPMLSASDAGIETGRGVCAGLTSLTSWFRPGFGGLTCVCMCGPGMADHACTQAWCAMSCRHQQGPSTLLVKTYFMHTGYFPPSTKSFNQFYACTAG
eukprot:scaffold47535_cov18-Tisochrysis_lutea.AAC.1